MKQKTKEKEREWTDTHAFDQHGKRSTEKDNEYPAVVF